MRPPRLLVGCATAGLAVAAGLVCAGVGAWWWVRTPAGNSWLEGAVEAGVSSWTDGGRLELGDLTLTGRRLAVDDLALLDANGRALLSIERLEADVDWDALGSRRVHLRGIRADGVFVDAGVDDAGAFFLQSLFGPSDPSASDEPFSLPVALDLDEIALNDVAVVYHTPAGTVASVDGVDVRARLRGVGDHLELSDLDVTGALVDPRPLEFRATGGASLDGGVLGVHGLRVEVPPGADVAAASASLDGTWGDAVDLRLAAQRLDLSALDPLLGELGLAGTWAGEVAVSGPADELSVELDVRGVGESAGAGSVAAQVHLSLGDAAPRWTVTGDLAALHVEALLPAVSQPTVLDGSVSAAGRGTSSDLTLDGAWTGGRQQLYGYDVASVDAKFSFADGVLALDHTILDGVIGRVQLDGDVSLRDGPVSIRVSGPLDETMLADLGVTDLAGDGIVDAVVRTDLRAERAPVDVDGTVTYAPFSYGPLTVARLAVPFRVRSVDGDTTGAFDLDGAGVDASGLRAATLRGEGLTLGVTKGATEVHGTVVLDRVDYPDALTAARAEVPFHARVDAHTAVTADVAVRDYTLLGRPGTHGVVHVSLLDDDVALRVDLSDGARQVLATAGTYEVDSGEVALEELVYRPTWRAEWAATRPVVLTVVEGGVAGADVALRSALGAIELRGRLGAQGPVDGAIAVRGLQLDHVAELFPELVPALGGALDATAIVQGDAADPRVDFDVDVDALWVEGAVRAMDLDGAGTIAGGHLVPRLRIGAGGRQIGSLTGNLALTGGLSAPAVDWGARSALSVAVLPGELSAWRIVSPQLADLPEGRASAQLDLEGPLRDPEVRAAGVAELSVEGWDVPARVEFDVRREGERLEGHADLRQELYARGTVDLAATTRLGEWFAALAEGREAPDPLRTVDDVQLDAELLGIPAASIGALAGVDATLAGALTGDVHVTGSPVTPIASGALAWEGARIGDKAISAATLQWSPEGDGYALALRVADDEGAFALTGAAPVRIDLDRDVADWATGELDLRAAGDLPLQLFAAWSKAVAEADGRVAVEGTIRGTPLRPTADLRANVLAGRLALVDLGVQAEEIDVSAKVQGSELAIERGDLVLVPYRSGAVGRPLSLDGERPHLGITGVARLGDAGAISLDGAVELEQGPWLIATDDTTLRANGRLTAKGQWPALEVRGALAVVQGRASIDTTELAATAPLTLDPSLTVVRDAAAPLPPPPLPPEPPAWSAFDVDVALDLQRNVDLAMSVPVFDQFGRIGADLTSTDLTSRLGGRVRVRQEDARLTLDGTVEVIDGTVRMLQSTFEDAHGTIQFPGGDPSTDAVLDLSAVMNVPSGGSLSLHLTGTAEKPDPPELSSEEYPDSTAQMAILLTGRAPEDLTSLEGLGAAQLLTKTVFSNVLGGNSVGTLSIQPDGSVRVGVPVTPSLHAATVISPWALTDLEANSITVEAEWSIARRVVLSGALGDRESRGDVFWEVRF